MKVHEIHKHIEFLVKENWEPERDDENEDNIMEAEEWDSALVDAWTHANEDEDALYAFLTVSASDKGAEYDWNAGDFSDEFESRYQGGGPHVDQVIRDYFQGSDLEDADMVSLAGDPHKADYFQWEEWVKDQHKELDLMVRGNYTYLFTEA
mgnify:CR=1 FL=1